MRVLSVVFDFAANLLYIHISVLNVAFFKVGVSKLRFAFVFDCNNHSFILQAYLKTKI